MSFVIRLRDLSVRARNVLEPAVLTTQLLPYKPVYLVFSSHIYIGYNCRCGAVEKVTAGCARGLLGVIPFTCIHIFPDLAGLIYQQCASPQK